jgi:hypothetical protein
MGRIADQLKARLDEMKARHAASDAETARLRAEVSRDLKRLEASWGAMEEALR